MGRRNERRQSRRVAMPGSERSGRVLFHQLGQLVYASLASGIIRAIRSEPDRVQSSGLSALHVIDQVIADVKYLIGGQIDNPANGSEKLMRRLPPTDLGANDNVLDRSQFRLSGHHLVKSAIIVRSHAQYQTALG